MTDINDDNNDNNKSDIHANHRERMRKQFLKNGSERFHDHQALELLLFYVIPRKDTNPVAHALLNKFGSIAGVLNAPYEELIKVDGVGGVAASLLKFLPPFLARYLNSMQEGDEISNTTEMCLTFMRKFMGIQNEELWIICLNETLKMNRFSKKLSFPIDKHMYGVYNYNAVI